MDEQLVDEYRDNVYDQVVKVGKILGNVTRLRILDILTQGPKTVDAIATTVALSVPTTSRNLQLLKQVNLVTIKKDKNYITYALVSERVQRLLSALIDICEETLPEMTQLQDKLRVATNSPKELTITELKAKINDPNVFLVDLRPKDEFNTQHLPNAVNIPYFELDERLNNLPRDKDIVVYCRGRLCAYADVASKELKNSGYQVETFNQTVWEWEQVV